MKGYSRAVDSARLVHMFHAWCAGSGASVWFEYVPSKANPADEPSRDMSLCDSDFHIMDGVVSEPVPVEFPPLGRLSDPLGWLREARAMAL